MLRTFIQITSLTLTLEAAFFLAKGNLGLSADTIAELSSTKWGYHTGVIRSLAQQRADTWIGVLLLLLAFVGQLSNAIWPVRWKDFDVHRGAAIYAIVLSLLIGFGAHFLSQEIAQDSESRVRRILKIPHETPIQAQSQPESGDTTNQGDTAPTEPPSDSAD